MTRQVNKLNKLLVVIVIYHMKCRRRWIMIPCTTMKAQTTTQISMRTILQIFTTMTITCKETFHNNHHNKIKWNPYVKRSCQTQNLQCRQTWQLSNIINNNNRHQKLFVNQNINSLIRLSHCPPLHLRVNLIPCYQVKPIKKTNRFNTYNLILHWQKIMIMISQ